MKTKKQNFLAETIPQKLSVLNNEKWVYMLIRKDCRWSTLFQIVKTHRKCSLFRTLTDKLPDQTNGKKKRKKEVFDNAFEQDIRFRYKFLLGNLLDFNGFDAVQRHADIDGELRRISPRVMNAVEVPNPISFHTKWHPMILVHTPSSLSMSHLCVCRYVVFASRFRLQHYVVVFIYRSSWQRMDVVVEWMKKEYFSLLEDKCIFQSEGSCYIYKNILYCFVFLGEIYICKDLGSPLVMIDGGVKWEERVFLFFCMAKHILNEYIFLQCTTYSSIGSFFLWTVLFSYIVHLSLEMKLIPILNNFIVQRLPFF